ncbi:MAG: CopG family antitoxin [Deltaproteobacteria bacterium]|nr:CopG family antitoxin [Deltaproteobacteria bacterium]
MKKRKLNPEDQEMLEAFDAGEFESDLKDERRTQLAQLAEETIRKDKRINIRISSRDLEALQRRAIEEGLPYQSLVSSVLHKYVSGSFKDISANKALQRTSR